MWRTLKSTADVFLKTSIAQQDESRQRLDREAQELQTQVKDLLATYPDEGSGVPISSQHGASGAGVGGDAGASTSTPSKASLEEVAQLLTRLCDQPTPPDHLAGAPNAIPSPRFVAPTMPRGHAAFTAEPGGRQPPGHLHSDIPSLRWDAACPAGALPAGGGAYAGAGAGAPGALSRRVPTHVRQSRLELDEDGELQQRPRELPVPLDAQLCLRQAHPDVSPIGIHHLLLEEAVEMDALPERDDMVWYKLYAQEEEMRRTRELLVTLFHTSACSADAWARTADAFLHGLALPDPEAARALAQLKARGDGKAVAEIVVKRWTPESYPERFAELQKTMDRWLGELLEQREEETDQERSAFQGRYKRSAVVRQGGTEAGAGAATAAAAAAGELKGRESRRALPSRGSSRAAAEPSESQAAREAAFRYHEYDFVTYKLNIMPFTYLQMVGQKLLYHATLQVPCLLQLPERIPEWVLRSLYARPFAEAVRLAIQNALSAASEPRGAISALIDERMAGSKQYRTLLDSRDERRRREARDAALAAGGAIGGEGPGGLGGGGEGGGGGGGGDEGEAALAQARNALGYIMYLFRDVAAFEKGFGEILRGRVLRYPRFRGQPPRDDPPLPALPPHTAAGYAGVVHDEVARVVREMRPELRQFITSCLMTAVQTCLSGDDARRPPYPVMVSYDAWPKAEFMELSDLDYVQAQIRAHESAAGALSATASVLSAHSPLARTPEGGSSGGGTSSPQGVKSRKPQPPLATAVMKSLYSRGNSLAGSQRTGSNLPSNIASNTASSGGASGGTGSHGGAGSAGGAAASVTASGGGATDSSPAKADSSSPLTATPPPGRTSSPGGPGVPPPPASAAAAAAIAAVVAARPPPPPSGGAPFLSGPVGADGGGSEAGGDGGDGPTRQRREGLQGDRSMHEGGEDEEEDDKDAPEYVDVVSQRVLDFVAWLLGAVDQYPETVQALLAGATLECLSLLMDRLGAACTTLHDAPRSPLPLLFLFHSAAACVRRRLESFRRGLDVLVHDEQYLALVQQHGECLVQADELVSSLHRHIVMAYKDAVHHVVFSAVDRTDWCTWRPEVMRGKAAGPAVRVWHSMMVRMVHTAARYASMHAAEWITGQVLQESLACLAQRYLLLCPSLQMLPEFVADSVHAVASVFLLCQPIPIKAPRRRNMDAAAEEAGGGGGAGAGGGGQQQQPMLRSAISGLADGPPPASSASGVGGARGTPRAGATPPVTEPGTAGAAPPPPAPGPGGLQITRWLQVPDKMVEALAGACRELLTRAALLHVDGPTLAQLARDRGLVGPAWAPPPGSGSGGEALGLCPSGLGQGRREADAEAEAGAGEGVVVGRLGSIGAPSGELRVTESAVTAAAATAAGTASAAVPPLSVGGGGGQRSGGGSGTGPSGGAGRLPPLPDIHPHPRRSPSAVAPSPPESTGPGRGSHPGPGPGSSSGPGPRAAGTSRDGSGPVAEGSGHEPLAGAPGPWNGGLSLRALRVPDRDWGEAQAHPGPDRGPLPGEGEGPGPVAEGVSTGPGAGPSSGPGAPDPALTVVGRYASGTAGARHRLAMASTGAAAAAAGPSGSGPGPSGATSLSRPASGHGPGPGPSQGTFSSIGGGAGTTGVAGGGGGGAAGADGRGSPGGAPPLPRPLAVLLPVGSAEGLDRRFSAASRPGNAGAGDEARMTLWSSWLPFSVVACLTGPRERIELSSAFFVTQHMPLGDRLADQEPPASEGWRQKPPAAGAICSAAGAMWRACLSALAEACSPEQLLEAAARRHELHAWSGAEPAGDAGYMAGRALVRALAAELGLPELRLDVGGLDLAPDESEYYVDEDEDEEEPMLLALLRLLPRSLSTLELSLFYWIRDYRLYGTFGLANRRLVSVQLGTRKVQELSGLARDQLLPCLDLGGRPRLEGLSIKTLVCENWRTADMAPLQELWRRSDVIRVGELVMTERWSAAEVCSILESLGPVDKLCLDWRAGRASIDLDLKPQSRPLPAAPGSASAPLAVLPPPEAVLRMALQRIAPPGAGGAEGGAGHEADMRTDAPVGSAGP
ncbi:hypothetical protein HYH03_007858 [Edaphochlamys debaryana]|uniref:Uncharacterized protein n=1 Tax=Edaphochlamys debaryana TaxID=47281 RepID=A0A835Y4E2_9CHLO|nr:hypothetical protein HYH03_007858 [Edaphochlamys debaryana]|eukprot:KAG2493926.1 hypothetical protein HYH03_007858 [Edaphochlamys debaryana]